MVQSACASRDASMVKCLVPWTSIDVSPRGSIMPCCKFILPEELEYDFNLQRMSIEEYKGSDFLNALKKEMQSDVWPKGCERCKIEEENNIQSKRQLDYKRWKEEFDSYTPDKGFIIASIAFGNTCNLKCITCGPSSSSRWRKESIEIYGIDKEPVETIDNVSSNDLYNSMPNIIHLDIPGGEPFLSEVEKQKALLQRYIDSGQSKDITIHYTTNAQIFPDGSWWNLWKNFKEIDMQLSIDGVGDRYEYIRHPANNEKLLTNVSRYLSIAEDNFRLSVSHTVSAYNIYYLDEFFSWCDSVGLPRPWCGRVHKPIHMRPSVFPFKDKIVKHLKTSKFSDVHTWANLIDNTDDTQYYQDFLVYKDKHDIYRSTVFSKTFPEVQELIDGV